jgi:signal transduction histidine kinase
MRQQSTYIAAAAHDMKNQLTVIRAVAQLLEQQVQRKDAVEPAVILADLTTIQGSVRKLQQLMDEYLDLARMQSDEPVEFNLQAIDLVTVARACVHECVEVANRDLTLSTTIETMVGVWDAARLERVISNLLSNAIKYSAPASAICVTLDLDQSGDRDVAVLAVQDQGVGIPAADLLQIFTPYYRGSNVAQTTIGTGIGLYGARAIIEQQGGTLQLESSAGIGATATIRLPLAPYADA